MRGFAGHSVKTHDSIPRPRLAGACTGCGLREREFRGFEHRVRRSPRVKLRGDWGKDFMLMTTYWAVLCRTCGGPIALAMMQYDSESKEIPAMPNHEPFRAGCDLCGNVSDYRAFQVTKWEGPMPAPAFHPNSAFISAGAIDGALASK